MRFRCARPSLLLVLRRHVPQPLEAVEARQDGARRDGGHPEEGVRVQLVRLQGRNPLTAEGPRQVRSFVSLSRS